MKTLVVYYSRTGTTKILAESIAKEMKSDIEEIKDTKDRSGAIGWVVAGRDGMAKKLTKIGNMKQDVSKYDMVIIGTPVWAGLMASAVRTFIKDNKEKFGNVAFFCTMGSKGNEKKFPDMEQECGKKPVSTIELTTKEVRNNSYEPQLKDFVKKIRQ